MYKAKTQTSQIRKVFKKEIKYKNINNKNNINNSNKNIDLFITYKFLCIGHFHHSSKIWRANEGMTNELRSSQIHSKLQYEQTNKKETDTQKRANKINNKTEQQHKKIPWK